MADRARVAVLRTQPETVLQDYQRLFALAGGREALDPSVTTILKDNISWAFPMPSANTTPWQLEGTILALRRAGFDDLVCVQNKTVVVSAFKGEDLNGYVPIFISALNHDYIHWPLKERHIYEDWRANTPWGQMFQRYQQEGHLANGG